MPAFALSVFGCSGELRLENVNLEICNFEIDFGPMPVHNFGPINFAILFIEFSC